MLCKQFVFSVTYMIAVPRPHYLPIYVRECRPPSGKRIECTANCALLSHCTAYCCRSSTHSEYSNNTFTVTTGDDISQRPTCDPQHSTQFPILNAEPEYVCTETDSLLQRARYNIWYSPPERLHTSPGIHALNKETLKTQSETGEAEVKLHSSFNKRTGFSQNCNSEHEKLAKLMPNSDKTCTAFRQQCKWWIHQSEHRYNSLS